jgi:hypothetical protein
VLHSMPIEHPEVRFPVLQLPKLEICFRCGQRLWLRQVSAYQLVREVEREGAPPITVDLSRLMPDLQGEVDKAAPNDRAAVIFFNVRLAYRTREAFLHAIAAH